MSVAADIFWLHGGRCARCEVQLSPRSGSPNSFEIDHIVPRSWGGENRITNYQPLCRDCNRGKSNRHQADHRKVKPEFRVIDQWVRQGPIVCDPTPCGVL